MDENTNMHEALEETQQTNSRNTAAEANIPVAVETMPVHLDPTVQALLKQNQMLMEKQLEKDQNPSRKSTGKHQIKIPETYSDKQYAKIIDGWIYAMSKYIQGTKTDSEEGLALSTSLLTDDARTWCMHVETSTSISTPSSWKAFKTMLEREFRPKDTWYTTRTKMETLKQTGSVPEYANEFRSLLLQIEHNLPEEEVVFQFIFRLKENIRKCVRDTNPETLEEAVQAAERYDNIYHEPQGARDFAGRNRFVSNRPNFGRANFNRGNGGRSTPTMTRPTPIGS
jgi:hypothetical protein